MIKITQKLLYSVFWAITILMIALPIIVVIQSGVLYCMAMIFIELVIGVLVAGYIFQAIVTAGSKQL